MMAEASVHPLEVTTSNKVGFAVIVFFGWTSEGFNGPR
jgi:hypothetical protein